MKFLTEHLRSLLRAAIKQHVVQDFHPRAVPVIRDVVLGAQGEDGKRPGRLFLENGMRVYDLEVLGVSIGDAAIEQLLVKAQHSAVEQTLLLGGERRRLDLTREREAIEQEIQRIQAVTARARCENDRLALEDTHALELARIRGEATARTERLAAQTREQAALDAVNEAELGRRRAAEQVELDNAERELALKLRAIAAEVAAASEKAKAFSPELVAALQAFGDRALAERMAESMAPLAILGGESVSAVLARLLEGTKLAKVLGETNGAGYALPAAARVPPAE